MATLTLTIPDALVPAVLAALKWKYAGVDVTGLGPAAAARKILRHVLIETYREHQVTLRNTALLADYNAALATAQAEVEAEVGGITA